MYELRHYLSPDGQDLFARWLDGLRDRQAQARVAARLIRLNNGNFGGCKPVGEGVWELRVDWGRATGFTTPLKVSALSCSVAVATNEASQQTLPGRSNDGKNGSKGERNDHKHET